MSAELDFCDDGTGYQITNADLEFLNLTATDLADMLTRVRPLGMSLDDYRWFVDDLGYALQRDGVSDADVRLQGSSAHLWSGWHKSMPYNREAMFELLANLPGPRPNARLIERCLDSVETQWPATAPRPHRRPFDVLLRTDIDVEPSDYDVQISSDDMLAIIRRDVEQRHGVDFTGIQVADKKYQFVVKELAEEALRYVGAWADRAAETLGRTVTWAVFPLSGPSKNLDDPRLSSHFKSTDWKIVN